MTQDFWAFSDPLYISGAVWISDVEPLSEHGRWKRRGNGRVLPDGLVRALVGRRISYGSAVHVVEGHIVKKKYCKPRKYREPLAERGRKVRK